MPADDSTTPKIPLVFYRTAAGKEPVRDWLKAINRIDRLEVGADLQRVQYLAGRHATLPAFGASRTISRVFICFHGGALYALHGFIKKTQKTPDEELAIARRRKQEVENG